LSVRDPDPYRLDARAVRRSFDRASAGYDAAAVLQAQVRSTLLERLDWVTIEPRVILDAGAGTGAASQALKRRYRKALVVALDASAGMLRIAARRSSFWRPFTRVCADAAALPLASGSVDLIVSNFMLPWSDAEATFAEFRRVLAPRGLLSFTTLGPDTLHELRAAFASVDAHSHVNRFLDMHEVGDALVRAGFADPVLDVERYTLWYSDLRALALDLKACGVRNATAGRSRGLTSPRAFAAAAADYETERRDGRLPATYEVVFAQAWTPLEAAPRAPGERSVSLQNLRAQLAARRHK
jgi:malonyl-CoA O-methyltransferase